MKQLLLIATAFGLAAFTAQADSAQSSQATKAQPVPSLEISAPEQLWLAKGSSQGCATTTAGNGSQRCTTKDGTISFPVMIGVYR